MKGPTKADPTKRRRPPQAFAVDDPAIATAQEDTTAADRSSSEQPDFTAKADPTHTTSSATAAQKLAPHGPRYRPGRRGLHWGSILLSAISALVMLAATAWLTRFITDTIAGNDWLAWASFVALIIAVVAMLAITLREIAGIMRLRKLQKFRRDVEQALAGGDRKGELRAVRRLRAIYRERPDMSWSLARFGEREQEIGDAGDLLILAERDILQPLDKQARFAITATAKKVSLVTAISPIALIDVLYVLTQNLKLLRQLATLYGARPGFVGGLRLAKLVAGHIIATGGLALTDDLIGQILGHDLMRRLSQRIGEGVFNGTLTARIGIAAIEVLRPMPFIEAKPPRLRDLVPIIFKKQDDQQTNL